MHNITGIVIFFREFLNVYQIVFEISKRTQELFYGTSE